MAGRSNEAARERTSLASPLRAAWLSSLKESLGGVSLQAARSLRRARQALIADEFNSALRHLDRAWRTLPEDGWALAPLYGELLLLEGGDDNAALHLLNRAQALNPDADSAALRALVLLRLDRTLEARRQLEAALENYCVRPDRLLGFAAGEFLRHPAVAAPGWIGRGPRLDLVGELAADQPCKVLHIGLGRDEPLTQLLPAAPREGPRAFHCASPHPDPHARLTVSARGQPLLGSGCAPPVGFALEGRITSDGRRMVGWARLGWLPAHRLNLTFEDEHGHRQRVLARIGNHPRRRCAFALDLRSGPLVGHRFAVAARMPDGNWHPLPDSPLLLEAAVRGEERPPKLPSWSAVSAPSPARTAVAQARRTDIIIPVYGGREASLACIEAVMASVAAKTPIVVVEDAGQDAELHADLDALAVDGRITLLRNATNLGFAASVNRALRLNPTHDAILLNSDTRVFGDWFKRLRAAAYSDLKIGTVTPFSNSGGIVSYPRASGAAIDPQDGAALQAWAAATHPGLRLEIPVGVGFCLYVRRDCLNEVGDLDAAVFGKGYGEETDFCLRARRRGWSHRLAADVFVYHAGGLSFGERRAALLERSQRLLNLRHPGFDRFVAGFLAQDPLAEARRRLDESRLAAVAGRCVVLLTHALSGGVERFVAERCAALRAAGFFPLVLNAGAAGTADCELLSDAIELPNLRYDRAREIGALSALLRRLRVESVEIQHFLNGAGLVEALRALALPYDVFVHDYAWLCPRITLIDGGGRYCGEPQIAVCESCVRRHGSALGETLSVKALRERSEQWLRGARCVFAPSRDAAARVQRHFKDLAVQIWPRPAPAAGAAVVAGMTRPARSRVAAAPVRIALIGAIGEHKGYRVLLACAQDAQARELPLEFLVIGYTEDDAALLKTGKVFITGRYAEAEVPHLLAREQPQVAWLPSVWPETWCYALDHALASALPVVAFDLGAIAERLRAAGRGTLLPLSTDPARLNDCLLEQGGEARRAYVTASRSEHAGLSPAPPDINNEATESDEKAMTEPGEKLKEVIPPAVGVQEEGLGASVQVLPLAAGLYLFSVKAAGAALAAAPGQLSLPAMQVGLGPGVRPEQVEFMAGPTTHGAWLFAATDLLVVKVHHPGATLILTSMRAPGGEVLSIKVERLTGRSEPAALAAASASPTGAAAEGPKPEGAVDGRAPLPVHIGLHVRSRGDMSFSAVPWAGRVAPGLWIESFSVRPLAQFHAQDIEYKGLTGSGFETPWLSDDKACGTQGMSVPLVGFALRFKPSPEAAAYDCEYSGYFQSGQTVGPLRNGVPCRSSVANDPLEGIQVRLVKRVAPASLKAKSAALPAEAPAAGAAPGRGARSAQRQSSRGS